jgi:hypothetical protein
MEQDGIEREGRPARATRTGHLHAILRDVLVPRLLKLGGTFAPEGVTEEPAPEELAIEKTETDLPPTLVGELPLRASCRASR